MAPGYSLASVGGSLSGFYGGGGFWMAGDYWGLDFWDWSIFSNFAADF